jgi:hypothetical protein
LAKGKFFTSSTTLSAKLFTAGAGNEGGFCDGPPAPAMSNFGEGIRGVLRGGDSRPGRRAFHYLQVKAALGVLYHTLGSTNPFTECAAPKFAPEKIELRYHTALQLERLLRELREDRRSYFKHLTYHLGGAIIAARLQVKRSSFRDLPLTRN